MLGDDLMVIAEEFGDWEDAHRRIDLLCLDDEGHLVVVELKRTKDGGHMELQALRYAAMVSSMTFEQLVFAHAKYLGGDPERDRAEAAIRAFVGEESSTPIEMKRDVRIVLASADFSKELTTSVLWLNKRSLDITCIRMQPYRLNGQVLLDVQQIVPLPEAEDYETKLRAQEQEIERAESGRHAIFRRFWSLLIERSRPKTQVVAGRTTSADHWLNGTIGRGGFQFNFVLLKEVSRVECYIDQGRDSADENKAALHALQLQQKTIEETFGHALEWQALDGVRACRICFSTPGGWRTPESEWPALMDSMIDAMVNLERALKGPVLELELDT